MTVRTQRMRLPRSLVDKQRQAGADGGMLASKGILLDLLQLDLTRFVMYKGTVTTCTGTLEV